MTPVVVTAEMAGPLADYAPQLDALLIEVEQHRLRVPRERVPSRRRPAPDPRDVPNVPLARGEIGGWPVYRVSAPVLPECSPRTAHFGKRIEAHRSGLLAPEERRVIVTSNTWTKSYRLPVRALHVPRVVWFAATHDPDGLAGMLGRVTHLGRKVAHGWGRVKAWRVDPCPADYSWFAPGDDGRPVLMRSLPQCPELPAGLDGWREDFNACAPPYWHYSRFTGVVVPC